MLRLILLTITSLTIADRVRAAELRLMPADITLSGPTAAQQLLVIDGDQGQAVADRTGAAKFASSNPTVAAVDESGRVTVVGDGEATVTAAVDGRQAVAKVRVVKSKEPSAPGFRNHVTPVLTRAGCNSGACHGALAGKGGLKLSLRGYDPETDHFVLTRQAQARRVDLQHPEDSLVLKKATRAMPHGGGTRFEDDTPEYRVLLDWIKSGAKGPSAAEPALERIEVLPPSALLKPKDTLQVLVRAWYADGSSRDVTRWSRFGSSEELVANVSETGLVTVAGHGEAAVTVGFGDRVATLPVTSPFANDVAADLYAKSPRHNFVDEHVLNKLRTLNLPPSPQCSDAEFIRRLYLDAAGILPTPEEVREFIADRAPDKRAKLVDAVLERPEFVDYWAYRWSDLMLVSTRKLPQPAMWAFYRFIRQSVADNKPWDRFAREVVTSTGSTLHNGAGTFFVLHKDVADLTESTAVTFLGMSITCARCHNHPLEKWTQDQYWSMANLFSRVGMKNGDRAGEVIVHALPSGDVLHPRRNVAMPPTPLDGKAIDPAAAADRRAAFADWLTAPENPYFARAVVNRVWKNFMGRGLVEAEDDLRETNPASNRELFDALAKDFVGRGYDVKHLIRTVCNSAAYQRSARSLPGNAADDRFYSRYLVRRLSGEVILDLLSHVTGSPTVFDQVYTGVEGGTAKTGNYPAGTRALQLPDSRVASRFLDAFGRPERMATCSCERQQDSTVGQALMLNNGQVLNDKLRDRKARVEDWLSGKRPDTDVVNELFALALCREPTAAERTKFEAVLKAAPADKPAERREAIEDVFWGVLTSPEFLFNH